MVKPRVAETENGITDEFDVQSYDRMQRSLRDKGWIETKQIIREGINSGIAIDTHEQARGSSYISSFACPESCRC